MHNSLNALFSILLDTLCNKLILYILLIYNKQKQKWSVEYQNFTLNMQE